MEPTQPIVFCKEPDKTEVKPLKKKLTISEQLYVKKLVQTGSQTEAAMYAFDCKNRASAWSVGGRVYARPHIQAAVAREFRKEDMDEKWVLQGFKKHAEQKKDRSVSLRAYELTAKYLGMLRDVNIIKDDTKPLTTVDQCKEVINRSLDELNRLKTQYGDTIAVLPVAGVPGVRDSAEGATPTDMQVLDDVGEEKQETLTLAQGIVKDEHRYNRILRSLDIKEPEYKDIDRIRNAWAIDPHPTGDQDPL